MMALRWRLRDIAEPERWSARSLSKATGLAYNTVWGIWTNKSKRADLDTIESLATVLKIEPGTLIERGPDVQTAVRLDPIARSLLDHVPSERAPIVTWAAKTAAALSWPVEVLVQRLSQHEQPLRAAGLRLAQSSRRSTLALVGADGTVKHYSHIWREVQP